VLKNHGQTNPEGRALLLMRRLIMDLVMFVITKISIACFPGQAKLDLPLSISQIGNGG